MSEIAQRSYNADRHGKFVTNRELYGGDYLEPILWRKLAGWFTLITFVYTFFVFSDEMVQLLGVLFGTTKGPLDVKFWKEKAEAKKLERQAT